jgi:hypothetical protein
VAQIRKQYKKLNAHADSYVWKFNGLPLNMDKVRDANQLAPLLFRACHLRSPALRFADIAGEWRGRSRRER